MIEDTILEAESRARLAEDRAKSRALQLAREQGYHRLALAIDRPEAPGVHPAQLRLWSNDPTLFDQAG
ncbi:MAG: hypothetical protein M3346_01110 [Actinomycetota bacterium]|nr:hypothetical protein [Actinomycetota bacterium]